MLKHGSIRTKILVLVLPAILISMVVLSVISYQTSKNLINKEISGKMQFKLEQVTASIQETLSRHEKIPEILARTVEVNGTSMTKDQYVSLLGKYVSTNEDSFGAGVWFEPNTYKPDLKYFGPYAYKDKGAIVFTEDYSTPEYDYPHWDWYKNGINTKKAVVWSVPYYDDVTKITMVTATAPFYNGSGSFTGVTTADINLASLQKMVGEILIGKSGKAMLLDQSGLYLAGADADKIMKVNIQQDTNKSLAAAGQQILAGKGTSAEFTDKNGKNMVFYAPIPEVGWIIALTIPENELYQPLSNLLTMLVPTIVVATVIIILIIWIFGIYLTNNIKKILVVSDSLGEGNLTKRVEIRSKDEFGHLAVSMNKSMDNVRRLLVEIVGSVEEISASSEQLSASTQEISSRMEYIRSATGQISQGTEQLSATAEEVTASSEQINDTMGILAESASAASASSVEIRERALEIKSKAESSLRESQKIYEEKQKKILKAIEEGKIVEEVKTVADQIAGLAAQTNMLALNAAIEAARAGESGRGFAVVADEVNKLAQQSSTSAKNIQEMLSLVQSTFRSTSENAQDILDYINRDVKPNYELLAETGITYEKDAEYISKIAQGIAKSAGEAAGAVGEVSAAMHGVAATAEQTTASSEEITSAINETTDAIDEIAKSSQNQASLAEKLNLMVQNFKI